MIERIRSLIRRKRRLFICLTVAVPISLVLSTVVIADRCIDGASSGRIYRDISDLPKNDVGLLLGASKYVQGGYTNLYFKYRVEATLELYKAGKIKHVLVSGDNSRKGYDEPSDMKEALLEGGIPGSAVTLDYAGFRTLDSVVRAEKVFCVSDFTVISQEFHNRRAVFLAKHHGIDTVGYCAKDVPWAYGFKTQIRERLARVKALFDVYIIREEPKFLGKREPINVS